MTRQLIAIVLSASFAAGCATSSGLRVERFAGQRTAAPRQAVDRSLLADYVQKLPLGTKVRVDRLQGGVVRGVLMKATDQVVVVQRRTRFPEPPDEIALDQIVGITPESSSNGVAKAVGIGAAAGAGAALAVFMIIVAIYAD